PDGLFVWRPVHGIGIGNLAVCAHRFCGSLKLVLLRRASLHRCDPVVGSQHFPRRVSDAGVVAGARSLSATTICQPRRSTGFLKWHRNPGGVCESVTGGLPRRYQPADSLIRRRSVSLVYAVAIRDGSALAEGEIR